MLDRFLAELGVAGSFVVWGNSLHDWLVALAILICGVLISRVLRFALARLLPRLTAMTDTDINDENVERATGPLSAMVTLPFFELALHAIAMPDRLRDIASSGVIVAFYVLLLSVCLRTLDVVFNDGLRKWLESHRPQIEIGVVDVTRKATKFAVGLLVFIAAMKSVGFDVLSLITGLGIGGLAVALAAQETLGNVLGSIQILSDQPFRRGDFVRVGERMGRVTEIGVRSTKILSSSGVRVILPNKQLAVEAIENLSIIGGLTIVVEIGLIYATTATQLEQACGLLRDVARSETGTAEEVRVHFVRFSAYSCDLRLVYFITDLDHHLDVSHRINMAIKRSFDEAKLNFAFPTQTLHIAPGQCVVPTPPSP